MYAQTITKMVSDVQKAFLFGVGLVEVLGFFSPLFKGFVVGFWRGAFIFLNPTPVRPIQVMSSTATCLPSNIFLYVYTASNIPSDLQYLGKFQDKKNKQRLKIVPLLWKGLADRKLIFQSSRCDDLKHFTEILNHIKNSYSLN